MDEIYEYGQSQVLPIEQPKDEEDADVYNYLLSVRQEAWKGSPVEFIERANNPVIQNKQEQTTTTTKEQEEFTLWQSQLLTEFSNIKQQLSQVHPPSNQLTLPEDLNNWRKFILNNEPPTVSYFLHEFDKSTKIKLLVYITKWLTLSNASIPNLSQWIWKLLLTIDDKSLLSIDEIFILRKLTKKAIKVKETSGDSSVGDMTLDMIITIVSKHFGQLDLLENI